MRTLKIKFDSIKSEDWGELIQKLKFDKFEKEHCELDEDEISDKFYDEVVSKIFKYGDYGSFEIIVDENLNIIGGKIFSYEKI